jgi:Na+:H+ antiporter, NhaA family
MTTGHFARMGPVPAMYRVSPFVRHFAWALLGGAGVATAWVNVSPASYYDAMEWWILDLSLPAVFASAPPGLTFQVFVADILMALFLAFIGKELWEALVLRRGALSGRQAIMPAAMTFGAMAGGVIFWLALSNLLQTAEEVAPGMGWYLPAASDVVLCYVIGRHVFGADHPALHVLLLITIASDIITLTVHGLWSLDDPVRLLWLALPLIASLTVWRLCGRSPGPDATEQDRRRLQMVWPYALAGIAAWIGVAASGLPPALGLLPVVPAIAHADRAFGIFAEAEHFLHDPLNRLAQALVRPVAVVLFLFGLTHGAVDLLALAPTTLIVLGALWIGKPLGCIAATVGVGIAFGQRMPPGLSLRDLLLIALILGIGFTVPALMLDPALPGGAVREAARMGLAFSLFAGPIAILVSRLMRPV